MLYFTKDYSGKGVYALMKQNKMRVFLIVLAAVLALFVVRTFMTPGHVPEDYVTPYYSSILSLLPPVVAIALALITKEVYSSLFLGILTGAMLYSNGNLELAVNTMMYDENGRTAECFRISRTFLTPVFSCSSSCSRQ